MRALVPLALSLLAFACTEDDAPPVQELESATRTCPPCGMSMPPDAPLTEIAGQHWAVCNDRCRDLIEAEPELFAAHAVSE